MIAEDVKYQIKKGIPLFNKDAVIAITESRNADLDKAIQARNLLLSMEIDHSSDLIYLLKDGKVNTSSSPNVLEAPEITQRIDRLYWRKLMAEFGVNEVMAETEMRIADDAIWKFKFPEFTPENIESFAFKTWSDRYLDEATELNQAMVNLEPEKLIEHKSVQNLKPTVAHDTVYQNLDVIRKVLRHKQNHAVKFVPAKVLMEQYETVGEEWFAIDFDNIRIKKEEDGEITIRFSKIAIADMDDLLKCLPNKSFMQHLSMLDGYDGGALKFRRTYHQSEEVPLIDIYKGIANRDANDMFKIDKHDRIDSFSLIYSLNNLLDFDGSAITMRDNFHILKIKEGKLIPLIKAIALGGLGL